MKCAAHQEQFIVGKSSGVFTCQACGLRIVVVHTLARDAVTVVVHPPRNWLAQFFFDLARLLEE